MIIQLTPKNLSNVLRGNICCKIKSPRYRQFPHRRCPFAGRDWSRISSADPAWGRFNLQKPLTAFGFPKTKKASESTLSTPFLFWENGPLCGPAFSGWGRERIRTAVRGFADLCLATRPPDPVVGLLVFSWLVYWGATLINQLTNRLNNQFFWNANILTFSTPRRLRNGFLPQ